MTETVSVIRAGQLLLRAGYGLSKRWPRSVRVYTVYKNSNVAAVLREGGDETQLVIAGKVFDFFEGLVQLVGPIAALALMLDVEAHDH